MTDTALAPKLTKYDRHVLAELPLEVTLEELRSLGPRPGRTVWQVGERMREFELCDLRQTLDGLVHLGYARRTLDVLPEPPLYWRTEKGSDAIST